jgi:DnaJ-class molecular chaperone
MKQTFDAETLGTGIIRSAHTVEVVCQNCGYDLDEGEIASDTCTDCGAALELKQSVQISVTSVPLSGASM